MNINIEERHKEILKEKDPQLKIDKLNELAYSVRYIHPAHSAKFAEQAIEIAKKDNVKTIKAVSKMHIAFARFLMSADFPILKNLIEASDVLEKINKLPELAISYNYIGNVYDSYGEFQKGLEFCHKALNLSRESELKEVEADTLHTMGIIYSRIGDNQNAIKHHLQSYVIRTELDNKPAIASSLNNIARSYSLNDENNKAEEFYNKAIELRMAINDKGALPWSFLGLASHYEKLKKYNEAIEFYNKSINLNKPESDKRCNLHCYLGLGRIFLNLNRYNEAFESLNETLTIARELNAKPILYETYHALANYYEKTGKLDEAYKNYKQYHSLKEEVLNTQLHNKLKNQQITFEVEKAQKEAEIYQLRNVELKQAFDKINTQNQQILDSIKYAKNIQSAVLPPERLISKILSEHFVLYLPKDIVSGDFFYVNKLFGKIYISAVDCTGHGVPGAFMSMLGYSFINEIIQTNPDYNAADILNALRDKVISALRQSNEIDSKSKDGMDLSLCIIDSKKETIQYAGAYNPLYMVKNRELEELKADRMPIGIFIKCDVPFTNHKIQFEKGSCIYMFSDGFPDQFGGSEGKKFMTRNFKNLLIEINQKPMGEQYEILDTTIKEWMKDTNQTDDILVMGVRL